MYARSYTDLDSRSRHIEGEITVSQRVQQIPISPTIAISNLVSQLKAEGVDIVSFSLGEPDFNTPSNVVDATKASLDRGFTHYTPSTGIPALRKAIADKAKRDNGLDVKPENVLVTPTKQALFLIALAYIDPGDEVILADPAWVTYDSLIRLAGGVPVYVHTRYEDNFVIDPVAVEAAVTPKTSMIILNTPSNPTGCVQPENVIRAIADIAVRHGIMVVSDEIYEALVYEGKHFSIATCPGMEQLALTVSGFSKSYAMTGWRIGWIIASVENIKIINKLQSQSISCCTSFVQEGAVEALEGDQTSVRNMLDTFAKRRELMVGLVNAVPGLECKAPMGAFYVFVKYDADIPSALLAERLLQEAHVAVTPGSAFGPAGEGFFRLSYATSDDQIREGVSRIDRFMRSL